MQETLYQTADAGDTQQTADAGYSLSDSGCRRHFIRQQMHTCLHITADAGDSLSDSLCRSLFIRQRMQETLYQRADAGDTLSDSGCTLSDRETSAQIV